VPRVLLFGWNDHLIFEVMRCLGAAKVRAFVMGPRRLPPVRFSRWCAGYATLPPHGDRAAVASALDGLCRGRAFDVVVPSDDASVRFLSSWTPPAGVARFPCPALELVDLALDKWSFMQRCKTLGVSVPQTRRCDTPEALRALGGETPFFVKPVFGSNSEGAARITDASAIESYLRREVWRPVLVQQLITGDDVDVSALCLDGKLVAWTTQRYGTAANARRLQPEGAALAQARRVLEGLGWHGLAHLDLKHDPQDGSFKVLELNPRFWMSVMFSAWAGVNFATLGIYQAVGMSVSAPAMHCGVYEQPTMQLRSLMRAAWSFNGRNAPSRQLWEDPIPQAWRRLERAVGRGK
jgi:D-aspartate ligase